MKSKWALQWDDDENSAGDLPDKQIQNLAQETFDRGLELEDVLEGERFTRVANAIARMGWVPKLSEEEQVDMGFVSEGEEDFDATDDDSQIEMDMDEDEGYF